MNSIRDWAIETLLRANATFRCHGISVSTDNALAVKQAVHVCRMNPFAGATADEAELVLLETYLATRDDCPFCSAEAKQPFSGKTSV